MSAYRDVADVARAAAEAALSGLPASLRAAMRQAGLREPGTLAELLELSDGELRELFAELAVGVEVAIYDDFVRALRACSVPAKRARRAFATARPEAVWT